MHDFAGIALVDLQQERFGIRTALLPGPVIKNPFGTVVDQVMVEIAGQRFGKTAVVGWEVTVIVYGSGINDESAPVFWGGPYP